MTLVIGSIQYASADHSLGGQGVFKDENKVNHVLTVDSKYLLHVQVVVRNAQDQLVTVAESIHGRYIPHELTDQIFDTRLGEKEIINIDKIRYEKARFTQTKNLQQEDVSTTFRDVLSMWKLEFCMNTEEHGDEQGIACVPVFQTLTANVILEDNDTFTVHWTILREF